MDQLLSTPALSCPRRESFRASESCRFRIEFTPRVPSEFVVGHSVVVWGNGVGLCGDAPRQGIARPTVRRWCIGALGKFELSGAFVFSVIGHRSHASENPGVSGRRPDPRMIGSFLRESYGLPEVALVASRAFCEAGWLDRRLNSPRDHDLLDPPRFSVGLSRLR